MFTPAKTINCSDNILCEHRHVNIFQQLFEWVCSFVKFSRDLIPSVTSNHHEYALTHITRPKLYTNWHTLSITTTTTTVAAAAAVVVVVDKPARILLYWHPATKLYTKWYILTTTAITTTTLVVLVGIEVVASKCSSFSCSSISSSGSRDQRCDNGLEEVTVVLHCVPKNIPDIFDRNLKTN